MAIVINMAMKMEAESYYERRAEAELELAEQAVHPAAVRAHYLLAGYYLDQVYGAPEDQDTAAPVSDVDPTDATPPEAGGPRGG